MAYATACDDSIAGMIPSVFARYSKAFTASSSVTGTYRVDMRAPVRLPDSQVLQK